MDTRYCHHCKQRTRITLQQLPRLSRITWVGTCERCEQAYPDEQQAFGYYTAACLIAVVVLNTVGVIPLLS